MLRWSDARRPGCRRARAGPGGLGARRALKAPAFSAHLRRFAPDGGDVEGPGYWGYSTMYLTFLLSALETALGNDLGLGQTDGPGLDGAVPDVLDWPERTTAQLRRRASRSPRPRRRCCGWPAGTIAPSTPRTSTPGLRGRESRPASSTCCGARDRRTRAALVAPDLRAFQEHRRRGASRRLA